MDDFRKYQPRVSGRSVRRGPSGIPWRRWFVVGAAVVVVVVIGKLVFGGSAPTRKTNTTTHAEITLVNDANVAVKATNTTTNTNTTTTALSDTWGNFTVNSCPKVISSFGTKKNVALTFDITGAGDQVTQLLSVLQKNKTPATFFSTGAFADAHPEVITAIAKAGYGVYSRGQKTIDLTTLSPTDLAAALTSADKSISASTGVTSKPLLRPPYGSTNAALVTAATSNGYCVVTWTVDAFDWQANITTDQVTQRVMDKLQPGEIVGLHAGYDVTPQAVGNIITQVKAKGYALVSLSQLLQS